MAAAVTAMVMGYEYLAAKSTSGWTEPTTTATGVLLYPGERRDASRPQRAPPGMATRRAQAAAMTRGRPMKKRGAWGVVAARSAAP